MNASTPSGIDTKARLAVVLGTLLAVLDLGVINISLPTIAASLDITESRSVWVATVYQLVAAASLLIFSSVSYNLGRRFIYCLGLVLFVSGSLGAAVAPGFGFLIACRVLQGLGAAALLSLGPSLLKAIYPAHKLGRALALNALVVAFGLGAGPTLGGLVLWMGDWRWIFLLNVPVGGFALMLAWRSLPRDARRYEPFDWPGALLSVLMMGGLMLAFERLSHGDHPWIAPTYLALAVISGALFLARQKTARKPLLPLRIFGNLRFSYAIGVTLFAFTAQGLCFVALSFLYQTTLGYSPLIAALLFSPWPITLLFSGPLSGQLSDRYNPAMLSTWGLMVFLAGVVLLAWSSAQGSLALLLASSVICGLGYGFFQAPNNHEVMANAESDMSASASGVLASVRTLGQSLGTAMFALLYAMTAGNIPLALTVAVAVTGLALLLSVQRFFVARRMVG